MAFLEAKERVSQLEAAIQRLDSVKKYLNTNADDIKSEISSHVTRSMECLQTRESSLYQKVAHILHTKEERLQHQQTRLKQALNVLHAGLTLVQDDAASESQLAETLQRLKQIELSPEETPYISFRANPVALRDCILHYGRVDGNGLPLVAAFEKPSQPSASLPSQLEDYEDVDHHFFHKTVQGSQKTSAIATSTSINVNIPKLSTRMEDWLQKKKESASPAVRPTKLTMIAGGSHQSGSASGQGSTPGSTGSLNNWLATLKQHTAQEEEHDFEIVDNSWTGASGRIIDKNKNAGTKDFFRHISKDPKQWLKSRPVKSQQEDGSDNFFAHITTDPKMWLACDQLNALQEKPPTDLCAHISKDLDSWLCSRAHPKHPAASRAQVAVASPEYKPVVSQDPKPINPDIKSWLISQDLDGLRVSPVHQPMDVSPANHDSDGLEVTPVPKPVVSKRMAWLAGQETSPEQSVLTSGESVSSDTSSQPNPFSHISNNPDVWLFKQSGGIVSPKEGQQKAEDSTGQWLLQTGPTAPQTSGASARWLQRPVSQQILKPQDDTPAHIRPFGDSCWLAAPSTPAEASKAGAIPRAASFPAATSSWLSPQTPRRSATSPDSDHSDSWSVCSSTLSRTSELHSSDVALASDFYKKWLL